MGACVLQLLQVYHKRIQQAMCACVVRACDWRVMRTWQHRNTTRGWRGGVEDVPAACARSSGPGLKAIAQNPDFPGANPTPHRQIGQIPAP